MAQIASPLSALTDPVDVVRNFTPNWFTVTMGTGIVALMFGQLAAVVPQVAPLGPLLWSVNIALFAAFTLTFVARLVFFPETTRALFAHPAQSMFVGAIPMGLATIVNGFIAFGGQPRLAEALWWIDAVLAVASGAVIPLLMSTTQEHSLDRMSALWLLPIVPAEVAAASAGIIAPHVAHADQQVLVVVGLLLWAFSVPAALSVLAILFLRLALHKLPPKELGVSGWLTLGPLGTGSLGMILLGLAAGSALGGTALAPLAPAMQAIGIVGGLILWAYGVWWWMLAVGGTLVHAMRKLPFNMGWWGFTFPLGVFDSSTYALAHALHAPMFMTIACALTILLAVLYAIVAVRTIAGSYRGELFAR
jgi:C4-dicarboxylate transporter/malic acid transport protein